MDPIIGQIILFAGNYAPRGWAFCQGQTLSISSNAALFSILGTMYGGNGQTTFCLPDLRGCVPVGMGTRPGLIPVSQGQQGIVSTHGTSNFVSLGMNYIIATEGIWPSRD